MANKKSEGSLTDFRVKQPIIPGASYDAQQELRIMEPELVEGDTISLDPDDPNTLYMLESEVIEYPDQLKARKEQDAAAKAAEADRLQAQADQLRKEAQAAQPKSASSVSSKEE